MTDTETELAVLRAMLAAAMKELRKVEWAVEATPYRHCPSCDNVSDAGHAPDCSLAAILARAEEP